MKIIGPIIENFKNIPDVKAIALAGSRTAQSADETSDYDVYIYSDKDIDTKKRAEIAKKYADKYEIDNRFFGPGDEWILKNSGIQFDVMYRSREWIENSIENTCI